MRASPLAAILLGTVAACAPAVHPQGPASFDDDLDHPRAQAPANTAGSAAPEAIAPAGKGARTGTIDRARLVAVLDAGPGSFLRQLEVTARLDGQRFIGWQLVQLLDRTSPLVDVDVAPGDVLLAINGNALSRPDQLQTMWDGLRTANAVTAELQRGNAKVELKFDVTPKL